MEIEFNKNQDGLIPAVVQDAVTKNVLMLGYMNEAAYRKTLESRKVTFYSRSKQRLWTKGEKSGNFLNLIEIKIDCDKDTFLISAHPEGPVCHTGNATCWGERNDSNFGFLSELEKIISDRKENSNPESYISSLFQKGMNKIAQKVGEEAVEVVIEAKDENDHLFLNESADLLFHFLILLSVKDYKLADVEKILQNRKRKSHA
ncbi:MAG TPA: bifunctional phosphoribosyl-AMP cyclohydrolase/phosphoribosyl-ATP diphosphatase HisIE [Salinimicrobium sp.]|nr:bifunctional phosphoribosyl-AMP cyclohydrolase/phosphoribosyl-ATP diphosphatase HisIE [Salinimicrobium sp.]